MAIISGNYKNNVLNGTPSKDILDGRAGDDVLNAKAGPDSLYGGSGDDRLNGDGGSDALDGGTGDDVLNGGAGNDYFHDAAGTNVFNGGAGVDVAVFDKPVILSGLTTGEVVAYSGDRAFDWYFDTSDDGPGFRPEATTQLVNIEKIVGSFSRDLFYDFRGSDDFIDARGGNDEMYGGGGNDRLLGGGGANTIYGGDGNDVLRALNGKDWMEGGDGDDRLDGKGGDDRLLGDGGEGETGNDVLSGGSGNDYLDGGAGNDRLFGGAGEDGLFGDKGNDYLVGGAGSDRFNDIGGNDIFVADADAPDHFSFTVSYFGNEIGADRIDNFTAAEHTLDFDLIFDQGKEGVFIETRDFLDSNDDGWIGGADSEVRVQGGDLVLDIDAVVQRAIGVDTGIQEVVLTGAAAGFDADRIDYALSDVTGNAFVLSSVVFEDGIRPGPNNAQDVLDWFGV